MIYELNDSLPSGYKLVVKDHPQNIEKRDKSINNLQQAIKRLDNVIYFNSDYTTIDLVSKTDLVISTSSHSAYQALFQDKKVALFGDNLYVSLYLFHLILHQQLTHQGINYSSHNNL